MTLEEIYFSGRLELLITRVNVRHETNVTIGDLLEVLILHEPSLQDIEWGGEVWNFETTEEYVENLLLTFDFGSMRIEIEHETTIPRNSRFHTRVDVKSSGEKWRLRKTDKDPFPSNPHAHSFGHNLKLDLSNGLLYKGRKCKDSIPWKELLEIRSLFEQRGVWMPPLAKERRH